MPPWCSPAQVPHFQLLVQRSDRQKQNGKTFQTSDAVRFYEPRVESLVKGFDFLITYPVHGRATQSTMAASPADEVQELARLYTAEQWFSPET